MLTRGTSFLDLNLSRPKLEVATALAGEGVAVPQIYDGFDHAMDQPPFMMRSEGPWEHALQLPGRPRVAGVSGLLDSFVVAAYEKPRIQKNRPPGSYDISPQDFFYRALVKRMYGGNEAVFQRESALACGSRIDTFLHLAGITEEAFLAQTSFTYWQKLCGMNATLVADDVFPGRYHVMVSRELEGRTGFGYCLMNDSERAVLREASFDLPSWRDILDQYPLAQWYEMIRRMPFFDPAQCPIIECQLVDGGIVFLQYHSGRDFSGRNFKLTREAKADEVEAFVYRGATGPEGIDVNAALHLPSDFATFNPRETASFGWAAGPIQSIYAEMAWPHMRASFDQSLYRDEIFTQLLILATGHTTRSQVYIPAVALLGDFLTRVPQSDIDRTYKASESGGVFPLRFHVTSDGERALVSYQGIGP
jgi:hypothetical protein